MNEYRWYAESGDESVGTVTIVTEAPDEETGYWRAREFLWAVCESGEWTLALSEVHEDIDA